MIENLIYEALLHHGFECIDKIDKANFYIKESNSSVRFAVLYKLDELITPEELNKKINELAPESFKNNPQFRKNCDLICLHRITNLTDIENYEEQIFSIEEDPHFYKKYVLYYSDAEERYLINFNYERLRGMIFNKNQFLKYKSNPLEPSEYSFVAKIFIKLPFLELPIEQEVNLVSLRLQAKERVSQENLDDIYTIVQQLDSTDAYQLAQRIIKNELENIEDRDI